MGTILVSSVGPRRTYVDDVASHAMILLASVGTP